MKQLPQRRRSAATRPTKKRSLQSYEGLLDGLPIGVLLLSQDGVISAMNAEGARLCGGCDWISGHHFRTVAAADRIEPDAIRQLYSAFIARGNPGNQPRTLQQGRGRDSG